MDDCDNNFPNAFKIMEALGFVNLYLSMKIDIGLSDGLKKIGNSKLSSNAHKALDQFLDHWERDFIAWPVYDNEVLYYKLTGVWKHE